MHSINELSAAASTLCLIDHQPWVAFPVRSIAPEQLTNNVLALAKTAQALGVPTVLSTINAEGGPLRDPLFAGIAETFPDLAPIDRTNTNAWSDPRFVAAIEAAGNRDLVMAGLWTEVCLAQTALSAIRAGYAVWFVSDASGGLSPEAHERACQRMIQAGARPMTWFAVAAEWAPDNTAPEYQRMYPITLQHGGGVQWAVEYVLANLSRPACPPTPHARRFNPKGPPCPSHAALPFSPSPPRSPAALPWPRALADTRISPPPAPCPSRTRWRSPG